MATDGSDMFVYWGSGSAPCWRLLITLHEKGLTKYGEKIVQFSKKEHKSDEVIALNPRGQMPTFKHGDRVVNESTASCLYLAMSFKGQGTDLLPENGDQLGLVLQRFQEAAVAIQDKMVTSFLHWVRNNPDNEEGKKERLQTVGKEWQLWDSYLAKGGPFIAGDKFTLADTSFFPYLAFAVRVGMELDKVPNLKAYYERVKERPSVQTTWPPHWKEGPGPAMLEGVFDP